MTIVDHGGEGLFSLNYDIHYPLWICSIGTISKSKHPVMKLSLKKKRVHCSVRHKNEWQWLCPITPFLQ